MSGWHGRFLALRPLVVLLCQILWASWPAAAAAAETPAPEKVDKLIELLSDPAVKAWLDQQAKQAPAPVAPEETSAMLLGQVEMIRQHIATLLDTIPLLPAMFERAWIIFGLEFEGDQLLGIIALMVALIAAGFGLDWLARRLAAPYRNWFLSLPWNAPRARVKSLFARLLYAAITTAAFVAGSVGVFVVFHWPALLKEILLAYLSAVILVRMIMMASRAVLLPPNLHMPNREALRALPVSDSAARHWHVWLAANVAWFAFVSATLGLFKTFGFSEAGRQVLGDTAGFIQLVLLLLTIWLRPRTAVLDAEKPARTSHDAITWALTAYVVVLWILRIAGNYPIFWAAVAAGALPMTIMLARRSVNYLLRPAEGVQDAQAIPPIYRALAERGIRVVLIVGTAYMLARVWGLEFSSMDAMGSTQTRLLRGAMNAIIIVIGADFAWTLIKVVISHKLIQTPATGGESDQQRQARLRTLLPIVQNIMFAALVGIAALMVLSSLGIEIGPLIAGAGVAGVAIGFGAQTLVKDVLSGVFFLFDDAFRVGEYIESGNYKGSVESFSLRSVKLRHHRGYLFTVPFGLLGAVQNMSRDWVIDKFNITVGYDTDVEKARKIVKKIGIDLANDPEYSRYVLEPLKMQGVQDFGEYGIVLRFKMKTRPGEQFPMKRKAYIVIKAAFEQAGITIPVPTVLVKGDVDLAAGAAARVVLAQPAT